MENEKELLVFRHHLQDLAEQSARQNRFTFSGFLGLSEQDLFRQEEKHLRYAGCALFGGAENCDRVVVRFGSVEDLGYEEPFPIACLHITPKMEKYAEALSHRDYLGALMNLGLDRSTLGDIRVGEKEAYLFCLSHVASYLCESLTQVRNTPVRCREVEAAEDLPEEAPEQKLVQVQSERLDSLIARVYNLARGDVPELLRAGKVYVEGRQCTDGARTVKEGETVNVRGSGKFRLAEFRGESRKGKTNVLVEIFR